MPISASCFSMISLFTLLVGSRFSATSNNLDGPLSNARLKKYLIEDPNEPSITDLATAKQYLKDCCYVQFQIIDDLLERGQVEGLLSFLLDVRYLYEEH